MDCLVVDSVKNLKVNTKYIGRGTTAKCYKTSDNRVLKVFRNTWRVKQLFRCLDSVDEHYDNLSKLSNDSYVGPSLMVKVISDELVAYYMEYKNAKTIKRFRSNIRIRDLIDPYNKLVVDTMLVSDAHFRVSDLHTANILFNGVFYMIDLDHGRFDEYHNVDDIMKYNMCDIVRVIIDAIFGVGYFKYITFNDVHLDNLYDDLINNDYRLFEEFINEIEKRLGIVNPSIGYLKRNRDRMLTLQKREDYYGRF